ncbi:MAG: 2,3-diphosphoglycerate synthetase [Gaiellaceae bacterium]
MNRALAIIDGEHYPPVVQDALATLPYDFGGAWLVGGKEKLRGDDEYGVPLFDELERALAELEPDVVVDLSDEPVLGPRERFRVASRVLAHGIPYVGPDFRFDPPELQPFDLPSIGIVGTGKRVGKTAVAGHALRLFAQDRDVVVVAMGRGGPPEPEVERASPTLERLLELSRNGRHAASDYLEDAAFGGVDAIGSRRCGGGLAGAVATSNVAEGARLALERGADLVIFEGSGAAFPPIATARRILVANSSIEPALLTGYLNTYRVLVSDLVVLTGAEEGSRHDELRAAVDEVKPNLTVVATEMRPRPAEPVEGKRVAVFTTAREETHERLARLLAEEHRAEVVHVSGNLADREKLRADLESVDADTFLIEIKAAAIEVVAEAAKERGAECVFLDNDVLPLEGEPDLDTELKALAEAAQKEPVA